jgi:hypothetical protein
LPGLKNYNHGRVCIFFEPAAEKTGNWLISICIVIETAQASPKTAFYINESCTMIVRTVM